MTENQELFKEYPDIVTVHDMQKMLNIGRNTAYKLIHEDKVSSFNIGRKIYIPKVKVIDFVLKSS